MSIIFRSIVAILGTSFLFVSQFAHANENIASIYSKAALNNKALQLNESYGIKISNLSVKHGNAKEGVYSAPMDAKVEWDDHQLDVNNYKEAVKNGYLWNGYINSLGVSSDVIQFLSGYPYSADALEEINKKLIHFLMNKYPFTSITIRLTMPPNSKDRYPRYSLITAKRKS